MMGCGHLVQKLHQLHNFSKCHLYLILEHLSRAFAQPGDTEMTSSAPLPEDPKSDIDIGKQTTGRQPGGCHTCVIKLKNYNPQGINSSNNVLFGVFVVYCCVINYCTTNMKA